MHLVRAIDDAQRARSLAHAPPARNHPTRRRRRAPGSPSRSPGSAIFGRRDLDHRRSRAAPPCCRPHPSCQAACSTSSRAWSIMMRARRCARAITPCSASGLPNAARVRARAAHHLQRPLGQPDRAHAVMDAPRPEPALRDLEAAPLAEQHVRRRHPHVLEQHLAVAVRRVVEAEHRQHAARPCTPGVSRGTRIIDCCRCGRACRDRSCPSRSAICSAGRPRRTIHHLRPLMT